MAEKQRTFIDAALLEELRARAHEQSRTEGELLEEIVRTYLVVAPRACYELGRKSHRNADFAVGLVPSRSTFPAFLSRF
jgi:hypothetical protein